MQPTVGLIRGPLDDELGAFSSMLRVSRAGEPGQIVVYALDWSSGRYRYRVLAEEEGFLATYREATAGLVVRGNLVSDAHLVALLRQHGVGTLYTNDRDFRRFRALRVINPFEGQAA